MKLLKYKSITHKLVVKVEVVKSKSKFVSWSMKVAVCENKMNKHKWKVRNVESKRMIKK